MFVELSHEKWTKLKLYALMNDYSLKKINNISIKLKTFLKNTQLANPRSKSKTRPAHFIIISSRRKQIFQYLQL